jgi:hypothetical protein
MEATAELGKFFKVGTPVENGKTLLTYRCTYNKIFSNGIYPQRFIFLGLFSMAKNSNYVSFDLPIKLESAIIWVLEHRWVQIETFQFFFSP